MTARQACGKPPRTYSKHGITSLMQAMKRAGTHGLDRRTRTARALASWHRELVRDLGGESAVTTQQRAVVELAARAKLIVDSIDAWLFAQASLVDKRHRRLLPVVVQRQAIADSLAKYMSLLGLARVAQRVPSLSEYLASRNGEHAASGGVPAATPEEGA
ncbi:MAG: hypothetical protein ACREKS_01330 [Candidatus Rokuibacteriota bacterium]